jgi:hypothetical protein
MLTKQQLPSSYVLTRPFLCRIHWIFPLSSPIKTLHHVQNRHPSRTSARLAISNSELLEAIPQHSSAGTKEQKLEEQCGTMGPSCCGNILL